MWSNVRVFCQTAMVLSLASVLFSSILFGSTLFGSTEQRPHVIVIVSDDQGWGDLSFHGNSNLDTPQIDSLAVAGASFERFYVCPVCSPTRAEFLTGRYHPRLGVYSTSSGGERLQLGETTVADCFRKAGYATAAFGKWHNGMQYPYHPLGRGFDEFYGFCSGHWGHYFDPLLEHNGRLMKGEGFLVNELTNRAIEFIRKRDDQPFFVYLPLNTPHSPMQVPDRWWKKFESHPLPLRHHSNRDNLQHTRAALAMCENIDWNVGRILRAIDDEGISDETIVVFFCDNGPNGIRWNGGMKGRKGSTDEGGVRSPLFIRFPESIEPGTRIETISSVIDLFPTLLELCEVDWQTARPIDGISLASMLRGREAELPQSERVLFSHWRGRVSARSQRFRLDHEGALYDMIDDPGQSADVSRDYPKVTDNLAKQVQQWKKEMQLDSERKPRPFPVGHPDVSFTQLPARDATTRGAIERSNRFPNCSFFRNWRSTDDVIAWDVEVVEPGRFQVEIWYTCPAIDLGAKVNLQCADARLTAKLYQSHDPPLKGAEHDRVTRQESYVKDFIPWSMGEIQLPAGRHEMRLSAEEIPGSQVMDFRLMMLKRIPDESVNAQAN